MDRDFVEEIAGLAQDLHEQDTIVAAVDTILEFACRAIDAEYASISLTENGHRLQSIAATHALMRELDELQNELQEGPDLEVLSDEAVVVADTALDQRWPAWAQAAAERGLRSYLGVNLAAGENTIGTVNFYDKEPDHFDAADRQVAHVVARHSGIALAHAREQAGLLRAIDSRKLIGQAQGILMERYGLDDSRAFAVLARYSQNHNIKLRKVAEMLVTTRSLPGTTATNQPAGADSVGR